MAKNEPEPIIIGGCPRSGTTLLRVLLDSHPNIACGPEFKVIPLIVQDFAGMTKYLGVLGEYRIDDAYLARSYGAQILFLLERYRKARRKKRIAEKTPQNVHCFLPLTYMLPEAYLIHVIRDGRDVVTSLLRQNWIDAGTGERTPYTTDFGAACEYWVRCVGDGRKVSENTAFARYHEVRYEDLVLRPEKTLPELFRFIREPWVASVMNFHATDHHVTADEEVSHGGAQRRPIYTGSMGRWKSAFTDPQKKTFKEIAGPLLLELGYCQDLAW